MLVTPTVKSLYCAILKRHRKSWFEILYVQVCEFIKKKLAQFDFKCKDRAAAAEATDVFRD